jgi:hypothetical protein
MLMVVCTSGVINLRISKTFIIYRARHARVEVILK